MVLNDKAVFLARCTQNHPGHLFEIRDGLVFCDDQPLRVSFTEVMTSLDKSPLLTRYDNVKEELLGALVQQVKIAMLVRDGVSPDEAWQQVVEKV